MPKTRVLVVDDHQAYRAGVCAVLSAEPDFQVVGEASDVRTALAEDERIRPDLMLVDCRLPDGDGVSLIRELRRRNADRRLAMLSASATPALMLEALQAGACGILLKSQPVDELMAGLRAVARGEAYVPAGFEALVAQQRARVDDSAPTPFDSLSARQKHVLRMLVDGKSNAEVAHELVISIKAVETHRRRIMAKLGAHSVADLVRYAKRSRLT